MTFDSLQAVEMGRSASLPIFQGARSLPEGNDPTPIPATAQSLHLSLFPEVIVPLHKSIASSSLPSLAPLQPPQPRVTSSFSTSPPPPTQTGETSDTGNEVCVRRSRENMFFFYDKTNYCSGWANWYIGWNGNSALPKPTASSLPSLIKNPAKRSLP